ncbi:hypothetical protein ACE6H2_017544 [Prunus campanulata]
MLQLMKISNEQQEDDVEELQDIENNMDECVGNAKKNENDDNENANIDNHNEDVEQVLFNLRLPFFFFLLNTYCL